MRAKNLALQRGSTSLSTDCNALFGLDVEATKIIIRQCLRLGHRCRHLIVSLARVSHYLCSGLAPQRLPNMVNIAKSDQTALSVEVWRKFHERLWSRSEKALIKGLKWNRNTVKCRSM